jgi:hypothetical protein
MPRFPQTMINVKVAKRFDPKTVPEVEDTVRRCPRAWGRGPRGPASLGHRTGHPVMVEARDETDTVRCAEEIAAVVRRVAS